MRARGALANNTVLWYTLSKYALRGFLVKRCIIIVLLLAIATNASAEIGRRVRDFQTTFFYLEAELKFHNFTQLAKGKKKFDGHYFLSQNEDEIYLAELVTERGGKIVVAQSLYFPEDPTLWNLFNVVYFIHEGMGGMADPGDILDVFKEMLKELKEKMDEFLAEHLIDQTVYVEKEFEGFNLTLKRLVMGDMVVTVEKKKRK